MPKIDAATVVEHRAARRASLVDAAEELLRTDGIAAVTAGAVAARAGLARNSLYRYFDSIDDLVELVVARAFPRWSDTVRAAVEAADDAPAAVLAYARANLEQAADGAHGWRASISREALSPAARERVVALHRALTDILSGAVAQLAVDQPALLVDVVQAVVDAGIRRIDAGHPADEVIAFTADALARLLPPAPWRDRRTGQRP